MWGAWFRENYRVLLLVAIFLVLVGLHVWRRIVGPDATQTEFWNDATNLVLGALLGVLTERALGGKKPPDA